MTGRDALIEKLRKNDVTVLLGETGSGKTTRALTKPKLLSFSQSDPQRRGTTIHSRKRFS